MPRIFPLKPVFNGGELSPRLAARVDFAKYDKGGEIFENILPLIQGGFDARPGLIYAGEVKTSSLATYLRPFEYSVEQAYILEFGNLYIRIWKDGARIEDPPDTPVEVVTPYPTGVIPEIHRTQSADVMYLVHEDYAPRKLSRTSHTAWTLTVIDFEDGPYRPQNDDTAISITPSAETGAITLTASGGNVFTAGHVGSLWRLKHAGAVETKSVNGADVWTDPIRIEGSDTERRFTATRAGTWVGTVSLQRSYDGGGVWVPFKTYTTNGDEIIDDGLSQTAHYRLGIATGNYTSGTAEVRLTHQGGETWGYAEVTGYTSPTLVNATVQSDFSQATATTAWREGAWSDERGWPVSVTLHQGRLWFGGRQQELWASKSDDYENMAPGTEDNDALSFTVSAPDVNAIRSITGGAVLFVGTAGGELVARASSLEEPITPSNISVKPQSTRGANQIQPAMVDRAILFVQRFGRKLFEQIWDLQSDSFAAYDLTEVADHIAGTGTFVGLGYQHEPVSRIYLVRSDGECAVLTYRREQEVFAWSRLVTDGFFESVAVIPGETQDQVWFVVRRTIGGATKRYLEYLAPEGIPEDQTDCFFVDSGLTYEGAAVSTVSGLDHLEGKEVQILRDGATHPNRTVSGGAITLDRSGSKIHVGLPYESTWKSLRLEGGNPAGTSVGQIKRIAKLTLIVERSGVFKVGFSEDTLEQVHIRTVDMAMDSPPTLLTGTTRPIAVEGRHEEDPRMLIRRDLPLPLRILAIVPHMQVNPK